MRGRVSPAERLLEKRRLASQNIHIELALCSAIKAREYVKADLLLLAGANVNHADIQGNTCLLLACATPGIDTDFVERLLDAGAKADVLNRKGENVTAIAWKHNSENTELRTLLFNRMPPPKAAKEARPSSEDEGDRVRRSQQSKLNNKFPQLQMDKETAHAEEGAVISRPRSRF